MVSFHDNPEKYNNPAMLHNIDQEVNVNATFLFFIFFLIGVKDVVFEILPLCYRIILVLNTTS